MLVNKQTTTGTNQTSANSYQFTISVVKENYKPVSWMYSRGWAASVFCAIESVTLNNNSFYCYGYASRASFTIEFYVLFRKDK